MSFHHGAVRARRDCKGARPARLIDRPGLVGGKAGVAHVVQILRSELQRNMALLGINRLDELDASLVRKL